MAALLGLPAPSFGQEPAAISPDRPGQSTPPGILAPGYVQLEAGVQLTGDKTGDGNAEITTQTLSVPAGLIRIGLLKTMELRLSTEFRSVKTSFGGTAGGDTTISGLAGIALGTKVGITQEEGAIPETALLLTLGLPEIGSENFRPASVAPSFLLAMRNGLSSAVNLYYNLGAYWDGATPSGTGQYGISLGVSLSNNLSAFGEIYGNLKTGALPLHATDAGLALVVDPCIQLDLSGGVGITPSAPDYFINAGVSLRLPR
jgi:hypothetical protein